MFHVKVVSAGRVLFERRGVSGAEARQLCKQWDRPDRTVLMILKGGKR